MPQRIPASVPRLLDRFSTTPFAVYDALWNLIATNAPFDALTGAGDWQGIERNAIWRSLVGPGPAAVLSPEQLAEQHQGLVADLRMAAARYPADGRVDRLVAELHHQSPRFAELWDAGDLRPHLDRSRYKVFDHPEVGAIELDCDTLIVARDDLRVMVYTADPSSEAAERLPPAIVLGRQVLSEQS